MDYKEIIDKLVRELSYRVGVPNIHNKEHQSIMSEILSEWGEYEVKQTIFEFLTNEDETEGPDKDYSHIGNGFYVKKGDEEKDGAQKYKKDDSGNIKPVSDKEYDGEKAKQGKDGEEAAKDSPQNQQGGDGTSPEEEKQKQDSIKKTYSTPSQKAQREKEKEIADKIQKDKEDSKPEEKKSTPQSQPNVLKREKNKSLGEVNTEFYEQDIDISDEEYEKNKPESNSDTPVKLPEDVFGSPSKVPKKYIKLMERLVNARLVNSTTPPMTSMIGGSGAGKIQAQAGEVMSMVFSTLDDEQFEQVVSIIESHNEKLEQKKADGSSYKPPRYKKGQEPILDAGWVNSSKAVRAGIRQRYDAEFGEGNWEVENGAWDLGDEVEAMGMENYSQNKGFSTDMYLRVKNKQTGESKLDEVSLKKDLDIFLSQPSVSAVGTWALSEEESKELEQIQQRRAELKANKENTRGEGKKEDEKLKKREQELKEEGMNRVPDSASPKVFNEKMRNSNIEFYNNVSLQQLTLMNSIDDSPEGIAKLSKALNQDKKYTAAFVKVLKGLTHPINRDELRDKMIEAGFKKQKTTSMYLDKFSTMMMRTGKFLGDEESEKELEKHLKIGKDFNKAFVENMVNEPYKSGMMNTVREKFPLKSLLEGEEKMSLGGVNADPKVLERIFGTTNYDEIEENLTIDGPDEKGDYQLVFEVETSGEKIPLSTVAPRQRGLGYEPAVNLEMNLHPAMKEKLYCANVAEGRDFPEKEEYSKKYTC